MRFNIILKNLIEEKNITQKQLANELNIAASTIGSYVQGVREPDFEMLKNICDYFNVSTDYMLDYRSTKNSDFKESEILRIFNAMPDEYKNIYLEQGKVFLKYSQK